VAPYTPEFLIRAFPFVTVANDDDSLRGAATSDRKCFGILWTNNAGEGLIVGMRNGHMSWRERMGPSA
jgi:hypothetical protein